MIIDSSALIAILRDEPEAAACAAAIEAADQRRLSATNFLETAIVIDLGRDPVASRRFDDLLRLAEIVIEPVTEGQVRIAREAYRDYGRSGGHPARLNFGDCLPTRSPESAPSRSCSRAMILPGPISSRRWAD